MLSAKALKGQAVYNGANGAVVGSVTDLYFDAQQHRLVALHVRRPGWMGRNFVVYWQDVFQRQHGNRQCLAVQGLVRWSPADSASPHWRTPYTKTGRWRVRVTDTNGHLVGWCADILVVQSTGAIAACIVSHGAWSDFVNGTRRWDTSVNIDATDPQLLLRLGASQ